jgi:hypothetical protein
MFSFEKSITINKPLHQVFEYVTNPDNVSNWRSDVINSKVLAAPSKHLRIGDLIEETVNFGGPKTCVIQVTELIPDEKLVLKAVSGMMYLPVRVLTFKQEGNHTRVGAKVSAHTDGFTRLIEPISSNMYSLKWDDYLFSLKRALEAA